MHKKFLATYTGVFLLTVCGVSTLAAANIQTLVMSSVNDLLPGGNFACDSQGSVLYKGNETSGSNPLYQRGAGGGSLITITGTAFTGRIVGPVGLSDDGDATFQAVSSTNPADSGIYSKPGSGGSLITITGSSLATSEGAPTVSRNGNIAFKGVDADGPAIFTAARGGGNKGTIRGNIIISNGNLRAMPSINDAGDVAFAGAGSDGTLAVFVVPSAGNIPITVQGVRFGPTARLSSSQPKIIENQKSLLVNVLTDGPTGILSSLQIGTPTADGHDYAFTPVATLDSANEAEAFMNEAGVVAVVDGTALRWKAPELNSTAAPSLYSSMTLISVGDPLAGSFVTGLMLDTGSVLANGDVVFEASLANGETGIFQFVVPEPAGLSLVAATGLMALRRRR